MFAPKYRRIVIYGQLRADIGQILKKTLRAEIIEANAMHDHIHMLVSITPHISISQFIIVTSSDVVGTGGGEDAM